MSQVSCELKRSAVNPALKVLIIQLGRQAIAPAAWAAQGEHVVLKRKRAPGEMAGKGLLRGRPEGKVKEAG